MVIAKIKVDGVSAVATELSQIPKDITATLAFANGEIGWWGDILKRSKRDGNVHNPDVAPDWWEDVYPDNWEDYTL